MAEALTYDQIKKNLRAAGELVDQGKVVEADRKIRSMLGRGLTLADIAANLTSGQMAKLRAHGKKKKDAHEQKAKAAKKKATKKKATKKKATKKKATKKKASAKRSSGPRQFKVLTLPETWALGPAQSRAGEVDATYNELVKRFGKPTNPDGDGDKTSAEWAIVFDDGTLVQIWDWKTNPQYDPDAFGLPEDFDPYEEEIPEKVWDRYHRQKIPWSIGGNKRNVRLVKEALGREPLSELNKVAKHLADYGPPPIPQGYTTAEFITLGSEKRHKLAKRNMAALRKHCERGKPQSYGPGKPKPKKKSTGSSLRAYMREKFGV